MKGPLKIVVVGCGGREAAIIKSISESPIMHKLYCIGTYANPDIAKVASVEIINEYNDTVTDIICNKIYADLCIIGPEAPLEQGIVDSVQSFARTRIIGMPKSIARLETDKAWCRDFLVRYGMQEYCPEVYVPENDETTERVMQSFMDKYGGFVIKPRGLYGGKGVKVSGDHFKSIAEGLEICKGFQDQNVLYLIEEKIVGEEFSLMSLTDGQDTADFPVVRDFKRAYEGDVGPNTGGMGCVCIPDTNEEASALNEKVVRCLAIEFPDLAPYTGVLFGGFMKTKNGLKLLEYNCRFGDPEIIAVLQCLSNKTDFLEVLLSACNPKIGVKKIRRQIKGVNVSAVAVYVCPKEYPETSVERTVLLDEIRKKARSENLEIVAAGINDEYMTTGSRAYAVVTKVKHIQDCARIPKFLKESISSEFRWRSDIPGYLGWKTTTNEESAYKRSGVDINAKMSAIESIQDTVRSTYTQYTIDIPNSYGGLTRIPGTDLILVSSTDSVGSKTEMARAMIEIHKDETLAPRYYRNLGHDLVNHHINDILVMGCTRPLTFLDYFAAHTLRPDELRWFVEGVAERCRDVGCSIPGGETAEIKDTYKPGGIDLVGFINGLMTEEELLRPKDTLRPGDIAIALPAASAHTNGFTLINKILREVKADDVDYDWLDWLAQPHKCYLNDVKTLRVLGIPFKGLIHITGGGLLDNPPRVLPEGQHLWFSTQIIEEKMPEPFKKLRAIANITTNREMYQTYNCGVGMIVMVSPKEKELVLNVLKDSYVVGEMRSGDTEGKVVFSQNYNL